MSNEIKKKITFLFDLYDTGIANIAEWNKHIPGLQQTKENLRAIKTSIDKAPGVIGITPDEELSDYLEKATEGAAMLGKIPRPQKQTGPMINTTGSALAGVYIGYVNRVGSVFHDDPDISEWVRHTFVACDELREKQNRSETVHHRLMLLRPDLAVLHNDATNLVLKAKAESDSKPVGAAMALNRLMDQFKGALIDKCRGGKGTNYDRIADCLAANSSLTTTAIEDGQAKYDILSEETMRIRKNMQTSSGTRVVEILHEIEDHIIIITDALDPMKLGISFTNTFIP
jgi:hypothetical protein